MGTHPLLWPHSLQQASVCVCVGAFLHAPESTLEGQGRVPTANSAWSQENESPYPLRRTGGEHQERALPGGLP